MRELRVGLALTRDELKIISANAERQGLSVGEFLRYAVFKLIKAEEVKK